MNDIKFDRWNVLILFEFVKILIYCYCNWVIIIFNKYRINDVEYALLNRLEVEVVSGDKLSIEFTKI